MKELKRIEEEDEREDERQLEEQAKSWSSSRLNKKREQSKINYRNS